MCLIDNEIEKLKNQCKGFDDRETFAFCVIDKIADSYYIDYNTSKHFRSSLTYIDVSSFPSLRNELSELWKNDFNMNEIINTIMVAYMKCCESKSVVKEMDLYNYMM